MNYKFYLKITFGFVLILINEIFNFLNSYLFIISIFIILFFIIYNEINVRKSNAENLLRDYQKQMSQINKQSNLQYKQLETIIANINFPLALLDNKANFLLTNNNFLNLNEIELITVLNEDSPLNNEIRAFMRESYLNESNIQRSLSINGQDYNALSITIYENNKFVGTLYIFQNITTILEREKIQKRFIADASHELKTPISSIKGMIEILNRPTFDDSETLKDFLQQIEIETKRMDNIINDMLNLSRYSSKNVLLDLSNFNLHELVNEINKSFSTLIKDKNIRIINEISPNILLYADKDKFFHIVSNLISNAIKSSDKGEIRLFNNFNNGKFELYVKDEGIGIHQDEIPYIFDRYYRVDESRSRQTGGSGLGLAIVKAYVQAHKGDIEVHSIINVGTVFTLKFPISIVKKN